MRLSFLVVILAAAATPLAAQALRADTAAIVRAATDSGWRVVSTHGLKIVGDTATFVIEQQKTSLYGSAISRTDSLAPQLVASERRVERRNGKWVRR